MDDSFIKIVEQAVNEVWDEMNLFNLRGWGVFSKIIVFERSGVLRIVDQGMFDSSFNRLELK